MAKQNGKSVRVSVNVPAELYAEIAEVVPQGKRSKFLVEAARSYLLRLRQRRGLEQGFGSWSDSNHPELSSVEDTVRYVRSIRENDVLRMEKLNQDNDQ